MTADAHGVFLLSCLGIARRLGGARQREKKSASN
jgi:hypothetical protein